MRFVKFYNHIINLRHFQHIKIFELQNSKYELNILYRDTYSRTLQIYDTQEEAINNLNKLFDIINKNKQKNN